MAPYPQTAIDRLNAYNSDFYDPNTNPYGFAEGGHIVNFPQALRDTASVAAYVAATTQEVKDNAQVVVEALADTEMARDEARAWAAKPEDEVVAGGFFSALHYARKAAAFAEAAATFNPANFLPVTGVSIPANADLNTYTSNGLYWQAANSNAGNGLNYPIAMAGLLSVYRGAPNGSNFVFQTYQTYHDTVGGLVGGLFIRQRPGGTGVAWTAWKRVWDGFSLPAPTNAEIDAGANTLPKAFSVANVWRAALAALAPALAERFTKTESDARYPRLDGVNAGPLGGFRNKLINPNGDINQRGYASGAAATAANQYAIDRWRVVVSGQNLSWTTAADGIRTFAAPAGGVEQIIEAANVEAGSYKLSWTGTATATVNGTAVTNGGTVTINGQANVTVRFSGGTFILPQLERGTIVTAPERRPIGIELGLCQRYYEAVQSFLVGDVSAGSTMGTRSFFKATKRVAPTAAVISAGGAGNGGMNARNYSPDIDGINVFATAASGGPARGWQDVIGASAEL